MGWRIRLTYLEDDMKLTSCDRCGLVYDQDKIDFPGIYEWDEDSNCSAIEGNSEWDGDELVPVVKCLCGENIRQEK